MNCAVFQIFGFCYQFPKTAHRKTGVSEITKYHKVSPVQRTSERCPHLDFCPSGIFVLKIQFCYFQNIVTRTDLLPNRGP